jgi:hypothetical protein
LDSKVYIDCATYDHKFNIFAKEIMCNTILKINEKDHRIAEGEFYLYSSDHLDEFTHKDDQQSNPKHFYFHRFKNGTYKNGTFKGMDITFGFKTKSDDNFIVYGGFLIRALVDPNNNYIDGPCKVVDLILKLNKMDSVKSLLQENKCEQLSIIGSKNLCLEYKKDVANELDQIFKSIRVGLYNNKLLNWWAKDYRYLLYPHLTKKYKHMVVASLNKNNVSEKDIATQTKISEKSISTYINSYNDGVNYKDDESKLLTDLTTVPDMLKLYGFLNRPVVKLCNKIEKNKST